MELKEASVSLKVPVTILKRMAKDGLLGNPLDERDIHTVSVLGHLLGKKWFAGAVMKGIKSRWERVLISLFPEHDKIDRYVLNTYLNETGERNVPLEIVRYRVKKAFNVEMDYERMRKLRQLAYDIRRGRLKFSLGNNSISYAELIRISVETKRDVQEL